MLATLIGWVGVLSSYEAGEGSSLPAPLATGVLSYTLNDGASIQVHFEPSKEPLFPKEVLQAAVSAYQTITQFQGFSAEEFSFVRPNKNYAYDSDKTLDIYIGNSQSKRWISRGIEPAAFKDAPCFDTIKISETQYEAIILLPENYPEFIKSWEKINPSPLGTRNVEVDLRGTLIHEMLHALIFYYNKNLNKDSASADRSQNVDWYVEGLARYFETFAGARHDFFSQGFKETLPDKIRFSRGGSNFFMRYPDQAFTRLRYENALFWRFLDHQYGMAAIENLTRILRSEHADYQAMIEQATGDTLEALLKKFARSILSKDFGLKTDRDYLKNVAQTKLRLKDNTLWLVDGYGQEKKLGSQCHTDWIGEWGEIRSKLGHEAAGGDDTEAADVSSWATDFIEIRLDFGKDKNPKFQIIHAGSKGILSVQAVLSTRAGSVLTRDLGSLSPGRSARLSLLLWVENEGLTLESLDKLTLLLTNQDASESIPYVVSL